MQEKTIDNTQKIHVSVTPVTSTGQPAQVEGVINFEVLDGTATVEPDADGKGAYLISGNDIGTSTIKVSADADLGAGVELIEDTISLVVIHPKATALGISFGEPEQK